MPQMPARSSACPVSRSARERTCLTMAMKDGAGIRALGFGWVLARQPTVLYEMIPVFLIIKTVWQSGALTRGSPHGG